MKQAGGFRFLGDGQRQIKLSPDTIRSLAVDLGAADVEILDNIALSIEASGEPPFYWGPQEQHFIEHCTQDHIASYLVYRYKMSVYPLQRKVADFPLYVLIEPASPCNLRCVMCFQVDKSFTRKSSGHMGYMDMDLYRDLIDQLAVGGTRALTFASRGEPLLNPRLPEMLEYAAGKGCFYDIKVNTNATLLDESRAHALLSAGTSIIVVSVDSIDPAEYAKIRVGGDLNVVIQNVKRLVDIRAKHYPGSRTEVRAAGVKVSPSQDEVAFKDFWSGIVDTVAFADAEERWDTYNNAKRPSIVAPCGYLFERMYVWYDGRVNPCDVDYKSMLSVGSIRDLDVRAAWHSPAYQRLREMHLAGSRSVYVPCDRCGVTG